MHYLRLLLCVGISVASLTQVHAQSAYPSAPIRVIVPTTPGGASDIMMRQLAQKMSESMKSPVVVENKPGAGNVIGSDLVAKAAPDGYTVLLTYTDHVFNPFLHANMPYDTVKDFAPISLIGSVPLLLVTNPLVAANTAGELISMAKTNPGKLNFASAGSGSSLHLAGELFKLMAKIDVEHIPYKGTTPGFVDLIGGQVQFMFPTSVSAWNHVKNGKLRALAITSAQRSPYLPNIPTVAESGLPGYEASIWYGMLAPAGTPPAIVARLNAELHKAMAQPDVKLKLSEQNFSITPSTPEEFGRKINSELERWGKLIKEANVKL
ncbi:MAG: tripartite tricarboxylate transporter substrate binding protein [Betaproteobacteria bacterium]|nr:tripartite tricarboxylate transporter substrate binding protein [Burkholderiales bacterium]NBX91015.1 tripartite tricarboxylate transporter substrate binding protein [Betaproteobacteria bacterium]